MPTVTIPITSLTGGVSRQPPTGRNRNQVEEMDNCFPSLVRGCEKRAGSEAIDSPDTDDGSLDAVSPTSTKFYVHWIDRDPSNRFVCLVDDEIVNGDEPDEQDVIQVFRLNGEKMLVEQTPRTRDFGAGPFGDINPVSYLRRTAELDTNEKVRAITVADATFFLNYRTIPELYGDEAEYEYSTTPVRESGNAHNKPDASEFDRPPSADGDYWYAQDSVPGRPAGWYISQNSAGSLPWYARVPSEAANGNLRWDHLPLRMIHDIVGNKFVVSFIDWEPRFAGDADTNKPPSFIGKYISAMSFDRDRLFLGASESLVGSQAGDIYNFWRDEVDQVVDSDPVDVSISTNQINDIGHLVPFNKSMLLLTTTGRQFELRSDSVLTPSSANILPTTGYPVDFACEPITMGNQAYWGATKGLWSQVFEYFYSFDAGSNIAVDIASHVEGYIPASIQKLSGSTTYGTMLASVADEDNVLYLYNLYWSGTEKVQSCWSKWIFDDSIEIVSHHIFDDYLYLLIRRASKLWLEKVNIGIPRPQDEGGGDVMPWALHADSQRMATGVYNATTRSTSWTLDINDPTLDEVVLSAQWPGAAGKRITATNDSDGATTVITAVGKLDTAPVWIGRNFEQRIRLSEQNYRDQSGVPLNGILQLRRLSVFHKNTSFYEIHVTPVGREPQVFAFNAMRIGGDTAELDTPQIDTDGYFACRPMVSANGAVIDIKNNTSLPTTITNLEFVATFVPRRTSITR